MAQEQCRQCEEHARLHADLLGLGKREPCRQCEEHLELHKRERKVRWW